MLLCDQAASKMDSCIQARLHCACRLTVCHCLQEFYGFVTSVGISQGHSPPPRLASALTTASCIGLSIYTHVTRGKATASLAVASFAVLAVHISLTRKPRFSQLASAVFGLFYCGEPALNKLSGNIFRPALLQ